MKRICFFLPGLLAVLVLCAAGTVRAETVTFMGKSYCPIKYEITWPFVTKQQKDAPTQGSGIVANVNELPKEKLEEKSAVELGSDMSSTGCSRLWGRALRPGWSLPTRPWPT